MIMIWPEVFENEDFKYKKGEESKACADGLVGWGNCYCEAPPEGFGKGMVKIGRVLDIAPIAENLVKYADGLEEK
jgi:hypothetical protein